MMGMGFNFLTSPDKIEAPPLGSRTCLENSLVPGAEPAAPVKTVTNSSSRDHIRAAVVAVTVLGGLSLLG